jgi:hypothetical protein
MLSIVSVKALVFISLLVSNTINAPSIYLAAEKLKESFIKNNEAAGDSIKELLKHPNEIVDKYVKRPLDYGQGSAVLPLAVSSLVVNKGNILELGINHYSTKVLRKIVKAQHGRNLISIELKNKPTIALEYYNTSTYHNIYMVTPEEMLNYGKDQAWGVVFIDNKLSQLRHINVIRFANNTQLVLVHDAEPEKESKYMLKRNQVGDYYKFKCEYTVYDNKTAPHTTLMLSNFVDLTEIGKILELLKTDYGYKICINGKC